MKIIVFSTDRPIFISHIFCWLMKFVAKIISTNIDTQWAFSSKFHVFTNRKNVRKNGRTFNTRETLSLVQRHQIPTFLFRLERCICRIIRDNILLATELPQERNLFNCCKSWWENWRVGFTPKIYNFWQG